MPPGTRLLPALNSQTEPTNTQEAAADTPLPPSTAPIPRRSRRRPQKLVCRRPFMEILPELFSTLSCLKSLVGGVGYM